MSAGTHNETFNLQAIRFIWQDGPVKPQDAHSRLKVGDRVVIVGTTLDTGDYADVQQLWVNPQHDPVPARLTH